MVLTLACAQFAPVGGDVNANVARMAKLLREAAGADLVVFPELATTGYLPGAEVAPLAEPIPGPTTERLSALARECRIAIATGIAELDPASGRRYNTLVVVDSDGRLCLRYRKTHLWAGEERWATPGSSFTVAQCGGVALGAWICYDCRFPEVARMFALAGAEVALVGSAWLGPAEEWELAVRARAMDNGIFVAASTMQGTSGSMEFHGGSLIADPHGRVIAQAREGETTVIAAKADLAAIPECRARLPLLSHRRRDLYSPLVV